MASPLEPVAIATVTDEPSLRVFLDQLEAHLEELSATTSELLFTQYQTRRRPEGLEEAETAHARIMSNEAYQELVAKYRGRVADPLLARRLEVWHQAFRGARVSARAEVRALVNEISDTIVQFRYDVQGQELDLGAVRNVLRTEPNRERRRAAWLSFAPLSQKLAARTRELFHLRNGLARAEGFETYAHMQMDAQGLTLSQVKATLEELALASAPTYKALLEETGARQKLGRVQPWDVKFLLDGEGSLPVGYFPRSGIIGRMEEWGRDHGHELAQLGISVHFMEIPYNGLCVTVRPGDIRILANPSDGHNYYKTAFHELGHALHSAFSAPGSFILRREPSVFSEAMAELMGYTVNDPGWLATMGLRPSEVATAGAMTMGPWFAYLRQRSAHALFEYEAYANPDGELDLINAGIESRLLGCELDESPRWAAEPNAWYSRYPVYWQNYVLADVVASQIHHDLVRRFGSVWRSQEALAYVKEQYWRPGGSVDWQEKLRRGTGEPLNTKALVADLTQA
ncbi:MAG TPA: M3 family metallopeptidase [Symbiobacteriaceae bacterium]|nr:M3 family metallopeptidase [Symbiobacteriaceae bacterium]